MTRYVCIHGHFYQPPRENPWTESVEIQESAAPFHDWNDRITAECYEPNTTARLLDESGRIRLLLNNFSRISFNFGPTLFSWLERRRRDVYEKILEADAESLSRFSGHGTAIAQVYNHMILPLASERDKKNQILWGLADFRHRFGRKSEGMWLPETAADIATLECLADAGIRFTILAPHQGRRIGEMLQDRLEKEGKNIDTTLPAICRLPSGRSITIFFYDASLSADIAFGPLLNDGSDFFRRILSLFPPRDGIPRLVHAATDGETFGHHHHFGEMALAYCLDRIEKSREVRLSTYGEFLDTDPPVQEVALLENTSWSCVHGIERWRSDCGCSGNGQSRHQKWRGPLRDALNWLKERLDHIFETESKDLLASPWKVRDEYIQVILERKPESAESFLERRLVQGLEPGLVRRALSLLEMQRHGMLMFTSCAWFFEDIGRIETVQVLRYAARAIQLAGIFTEEPLEEVFLEKLESAPGNTRTLPDGSEVYKTMVLPAKVDLFRVAAHYAIFALFREKAESININRYAVETEELDILETGKGNLAIGRCRFRSLVTLEGKTISFAAFHLDGHNVLCGTGGFKETKTHETMSRCIRTAYREGYVQGIAREMDRFFGHHNYTMDHLFRDEKRLVLEGVSEKTAGPFLESCRTFSEKHAPLMEYLAENDMTVPYVFRTALLLSLTRELEVLFRQRRLDLDLVEDRADEFSRWGLEIPFSGFADEASKHLEKLIAEAGRASDAKSLEAALRLLAFFDRFGEPMDLQKGQKAFFELAQRITENERQNFSRITSSTVYLALADRLGISHDPVLK
ncbi:MAG: DUF3536 domain-containing protein [Thermovirgaceae bacterium]